MGVKEVSEGRDEVSVVTTGALYVINKSGSDGEILCYQNLGKKRLIASLRIHIPLERLTLEWKGEKLAFCIRRDIWDQMQRYG